MFGTRADLVVDLVYLVTLVAPILALVSFRLARRRRLGVHRRFQLALLALCFLAVVALETRIRLAGGSGALLAKASPQWAATAGRLLGIHISGAVATYVAWAYLATLSVRRYQATLPGGFSRLHRRIGWTVFGGLIFTAVSATGMYFLAFVV